MSDCAESAPSSHVLGTTNCDLVPAAPSSVTAEALSSTQVKISWSTVNGAADYKLYRSESQNGNYILATSALGIASSVTLGNLQPATTYYFKVTAANNCEEESELSASYAVVITEGCNLPIPSDPAGLTATTSSSRSIVVSWSAAAGAVSYDVYRSTERYSTYWTVGRVSTGTSFTDTTVSSSTTYYYAVKSMNACGGTTEDLGDVVSATTLCQTPVPTNIATTAVSSSSIAVSWSAVSGAVSYSVYRSSTVTGVYTLLGKTANTSFTDTGLSNLTSYFYKITAKTALCDDSAMSEHGSATTQ
jgi:fibronectin type 3 domain-containing protein